MIRYFRLQATMAVGANELDLGQECRLQVQETDADVADGAIWAERTIDEGPTISAA
jgi:hypothetical protein